MKKMIQATIFAGLILGSAPLCAASSLMERITSIYKGAKTKVSDAHTSLVVDGMMRKVHNKMPAFLRGDSGVDSVARLVFLGSALYIGLKPLLKDDSDAKKVFLGALGYIFNAVGVDNLTVQGANYAQIARDKKEELARDVRKAIDGFSGEHIGV